jgi:two-component system cell cycle sensor histidine kinase/response regulator CckA
MGGSESILVVEDEEPVREILRRTLARAGYSVITARTGFEGMGLLRASGAHLHLVVTDLLLPGGVSGMEIARHVLEFREGTRLLCISGYSEQLVSGAEALLPSGSFLQKPFSPSDLLGRVREILDGK